MDFINICSSQQRNYIKRTTRLVPVFLISVYLIDQINTFGSYPLGTKTLPKFITSSPLHDERNDKYRLLTSCVTHGPDVTLSLHLCFSSSRSPSLKTCQGVQRDSTFNALFADSKIICWSCNQHGLSMACCHPVSTFVPSL